MRIACLSDQHGHLPEIPGCDLLLIGGDISPDINLFDQIKWMNGPFRKWALGLKEKNIEVVAIAGNHDFWANHLYQINVEGYTFLQDAAVEIGGLKIWGTPWVLPIGNWAFMRSEEKLAAAYEAIPPVNILISHGPPHGHGDDLYGESLGSISLLQTIQRIQPKLVVCGHIHEGYGQYQIGSTLVVNAALRSPLYRPTNPIQIVEI